MNWAKNGLVCKDRKRNLQIEKTQIKETFPYLLKTGEKPGERWRKL
jgi:hypothetical protein